MVRRRRVIALGAALLSYGALAIDRAYLNIDISWLFNGSPSAARTLLSAIAGGVITVVSIAFSLTIVALQQASNQFSPRVMRNFTNDKGNQVVLGTYIATFLYSLLVLRAVRDPSESRGAGFAPEIATTIAIVLVIICVSLLIYFINHVASSLQAVTIIYRVHHELNDQVDTLYPEPYSASHADVKQPATPKNPEDEELTVRAKRAGFILRIEEDSFKYLDFTKASHLVVLPSVGDFVSEGQTIAYLHGYSGLTDERRNRILGDQRSITQDPLFGVRQLVDIALKALSSSSNDVTTACCCIYYLILATRLGAWRSGHYH